MNDNRDGFLHIEIRKNLADLTACPPDGRDLLFVDQRQDDLQLKDVRIANSIFRRIGARHAILTDCHLNQTVFEDCYFRNAKFVNVDFTGSSFINCNFDEAVFEECTFRYARFRGTLIDHRAIRDSLPLEHNLRREVIREIRANAVNLGRNDDAITLLADELEAQKSYYKQRAFSTQGYNAKYTIPQRIEAVRLLLGLEISDFVWGYGFRINRILRLLFATVALFSLIIWISDTEWRKSNDTESELSFPEAVYVSAAGLVGGAPDIVPAEGWSQLIAVLEIGAGLILFGLFIAALYRRFAK